MDESWTGKWITCDSETKVHPYLVKQVKLTKETGAGGETVYLWSGTV